MRNYELLQDAIGMIGDDLIADAKSGGHIAKKVGVARWVPATAAAVACIALFIGAWLLFAANRPSGVKNLWERDGFQAYSLVYSNPYNKHQLAYDGSSELVYLNQAQTVSQGSSPAENAIAAAPIMLDFDPTLKVESLIAGRYVTYLTEYASPVFYDTQKGVAVNLRERLLGDTSADINAFIELAMELARKDYPGMLNSEVNKQYLTEFIYHKTDDLLIDSSKEWDLDTSFMHQIERYEYCDEEDLPLYFAEICAHIYYDTLGLQKQQEGYDPHKAYRVRIKSVDTHNGRCLVQVLTMSGSGKYLAVYDIKTDTVVHKFTHSLGPNDCVRFSHDGNQLMFATNYSIGSATVTVLHPDLSQMREYAKSKLLAGNYRGDALTIIDLSTGQKSKIGDNAASNGFLSESGKVCYYKLVPDACLGKQFYVSAGVWLNRLVSVDKDTDTWVFCTRSDDAYNGNKVVLQGNFVRFMAEETIVVMEREGQYYAYRLSADDETNGQDITEQFRLDTLSVMPHERLRVFFEDGILYKQDLFSGEPAQIITHADQYILSGDGAFVFAYVNGSEFATCYNIATLESCDIYLDSQLRSQLQNTDGAVFRMLYNDAENTLTFSFYLEEDLSGIRDYAVDFYGLLAEYKGYGNPTIMPKQFTQYQVGEEVMDLFRASVYQHGASWRHNRPEGLPITADLDQVMAVLGFTLPEDYLSVHGSVFVLYREGYEKLTLCFRDGWGLYNYTIDDRGFYIVYQKGNQKFTYPFDHREYLS